MEERIISFEQSNRITQYSQNNHVDYFLQKHELKITQLQNEEFDRDQKKCHTKIFSVLKQLMTLINISRKHKINNFQNILIYNSVFMNLDDNIELEKDFLNLTKLDQYRVVESVNNFVKDLSKFIPEYNNFTYSRKIKEFISSVTTTITSTIYYRLDNGCRIEYSSDNAYRISFF